MPTLDRHTPGNATLTTGPDQDEHGQSLRIPVAAAIFACYFAAGWLGLKLAVIGPSVSLVWPPAGLALGCLMLFGTRYWLVIAAGAFFMNFNTLVPVQTALLMGLGNGLEALVGCLLIRRVLGVRGNDLSRFEDVFALIVGGACVSTTVSATLGVVGLGLGGVVPWADFASTWWTWWLGDLGGDLVVAPLVMTWGSVTRKAWNGDRIVEVTLTLIALLCASLLAFGGWIGAGALWPQMLVYGCIAWAAVRLEVRGASLATFVASTLAIWGTVAGHGPFAGAVLKESLLDLQIFVWLSAVGGLFISAAVTSRSPDPGPTRSS